MRGHGKVVAACLVLGFTLALSGAPAAGATGAAKEPAAGGLTVIPGVGEPAPPPDMPAAEMPQAPDAATAPESEPAARADDTSWGVLLRGGYFGLPDVIANELYRQHPKVDGYTYGGELRYHGDGGGRGISSIGFAVDSATVDGDGIWQPKATDQPTAFGGEISMLCFTVTGYWSMFPTWYVHPYVGFGLGVAHLKGDYVKDNERTTVDAWIPALHIPVGLAFEFGRHFQLSLEARVLNGIAAGGALQARF